MKSKPKFKFLNYKLNFIILYLVQNPKKKNKKQTKKMGEKFIYI